MQVTKLSSNNGTKGLHIPQQTKISLLKVRVIASKISQDEAAQNWIQHRHEITLYSFICSVGTVIEGQTSENS
jgi:hypothetical protein